MAQLKWISSINPQSHGLVRTVNGPLLHQFPLCAGHSHPGTELVRWPLTRRRSDERSALVQLLQMEDLRWRGSTRRTWRRTIFHVDQT